MVALKLKNFGGMIPAVDARLLPDNQAALSQNTWLYTGSVEAIRTPVEVATLAGAHTRRAYRIPMSGYSKDNIPDSYWLEFNNMNVDVIQSPTADDQYERFYFATDQTTGNDKPRYNTKTRAITGQAPFLIGVPAPDSAPIVTSSQLALTSTYVLIASGAQFNIRPREASLYYTRGYGVDSGTFQRGTYVDDKGYAQMGATKPVSSTRGNLDASATPLPATQPANQYSMTGFNAELRYGTTVNGERVSISDTGVITKGTPVTPAGNYQGQGVPQTRAYVYTWVTEYGEEGPPSPPGSFDGWSGDPWAIYFGTPSADVLAQRNITKVRIYRTVTAVGGATSYFFVTELDIALDRFSDTISDDVVAANEILASTYWSPPPDDMAGMVAMPNGIIAGFRSNEILFCEPYRPHAWPASYALSVEFPIVGLGVVGQTLIVCTTGSPYAVSGINPATMTLAKIATYEPCLSRGSIVSTPAGVVYASPNGLALAQPGGVAIITRSIITKDHWEDLVPTQSLRAAIVNGGYYCWGSVVAGCFQTDAFQSDAFAQEDFSGSYAGAFFDTSNERVAWTKLYSAVATYNTFIDQWTGEVLMIRAGKVYWLDLDAARPHDTFIWRSKIFETPNKRSFEAMRVFYSTFSGESQAVTARVYADGVLKFTRVLTSPGNMLRLPSGFKAMYWQVELEGNVQVNSVEIATSAKELGSV